MKSKKTKYGLIIAVIIVLCILAYVVFSIIMPRVNYKKGLEAYSEKDYYTALEHLKKSTGIGETESMLEESYYECGVDSIANKKYDDAKLYLEQAGTYKDAEQALNYAYGRGYLDEKEYKKALNSFIKAKNFNDAKDMLFTARLLYGELLFDKGDYRLSKKQLAKVPVDFAYKGKKASDRLSILNKYWSLIELADSSFDLTHSHSTAMPNAYYASGWQTDDGDGYLKFDLKLTKNGKAKLSGETSFLRMTVFSYDKDVVSDNMSSKEISFKKSLSSIPYVLSIGSHTTITFSGHNVILNYNYLNTETNIRYTSDYTFTYY